jgi:hypothetical protein
MEASIIPEKMSVTNQSLGRNQIKRLCSGLIFSKNIHFYAFSLPPLSDNLHIFLYYFLSLKESEYLPNQNVIAIPNQNVIARSVSDEAISIPIEKESEYLFSLCSKNKLLDAFSLSSLSDSLHIFLCHFLFLKESEYLPNQNVIARSVSDEAISISIEKESE